MSVLVFCNLVLLFVALRFRGDDPAELDPLEAPAAYRNVRGQFWKPLLCIIMIGIVSPVLGSVAFTGELAFLDNCVIVFSANLLSAAVLAIVWLALDRATTISKAYVVLFPVLITAFLLFPFVPERYRVLILFVGSFGFTLFSIVMMMSCISIAREKRISLVFVYSLFAGVTYVSRLIGEGLATLIGASSLSQETQLVTSVFVLLYGCSLVMFILVRKNASAKSSAAQPPASTCCSRRARSCRRSAGCRSGKPRCSTCSFTATTCPPSRKSCSSRRTPCAPTRRRCTPCSTCTASRKSSTS
nr:hypothetical protein [Eggerthella sinensis]